MSLEKNNTSKIETPVTRRNVLKYAGALAALSALGATGNILKPDEYPEDEWPEHPGLRGRGAEMEDASPEQLDAAREHIIPRIVKLFDALTSTSKEEMGLSDMSIDDLQAMLVSENPRANRILNDYYDNPVVELDFMLPGSEGDIHMQGVAEINGERSEVRYAGLSYTQKTSWQAVDFNAPGYNSPEDQLRRGLEDRFKLPGDATWSDVSYYTQYKYQPDTPYERRVAELHTDHEDPFEGVKYSAAATFTVPSSPDKENLPTLKWQLFEVSLEA